MIFIQDLSPCPSWSLTLATIILPLKTPKSIISQAYMSNLKLYTKPIKLSLQQTINHVYNLLQASYSPTLAYFSYSPLKTSWKHATFATMTSILKPNHPRAQNRCGQFQYAPRNVLTLPKFSQNRPIISNHYKTFKSPPIQISFHSPLDDPKTSQSHPSQPS